MAGKARTSLWVDTRDAAETIRYVSRCLTEDSFNKVMYRAMKRSGTAVRQATVNAVKAEYTISQTRIRQSIQPPFVRRGHGAMGMQSIVRIAGPRGKIGRGEAYKARAQGRRIFVRGQPQKAGRYKVMAQIIRGKESALPSVDEKGRALHPFIAGGRGLKAGKAYVRIEGTSMRFPEKNGGFRMAERVIPAVGIGVAQMPMTRSAEQIQRRGLEILSSRIEHEFLYHLQHIKGGT